MEAMIHKAEKSHVQLTSNTQTVVTFDKIAII